MQKQERSVVHVLEAIPCREYNFYDIYMPHTVVTNIIVRIVGCCVNVVILENLWNYFCLLALLFWWQCPRF